MKKFILKISSQYTDGLVDAEIIHNDFTFDFEFNRIAVGIFEVPQFDKLKHFLEFQSTYASANVIYGEDSLIATTLNNTASDLVFEYGGFIVITELVSEEEYTPQELSEIYHACSILTRSGNEKLVELASRIGFLRPRS